ncbi:MAG: hypothetical protein AAF493_27135 [Pseudomonadota bacterium]
MTAFSLSPISATLLLVVMLGAGRVFRDNWKRQCGAWKRNCWVSGVMAAFAFAALVALPIDQ